MRETAALMGQYAVVRVLCGVLRHADAEGPALFHTFENEINPVGILLHQTAQHGQHVVFFANSLFGPFDRDPMIAGIGLDPALVSVRALAQRLLAHYWDAEHFTKEINH